MSDNRGECNNPVTGELVNKQQKAMAYWIASRAWRGDPLFGADFNIGSLIRHLTNLAGACNCTWDKLENHTANLLDQVIRNKKSRKVKNPPSNLVFLNTRRANLPDAILPDGTMLEYKTGNSRK